MTTPRRPGGHLRDANEATETPTLAHLNFQMYDIGVPGNSVQPGEAQVSDLHRDRNEAAAGAAEDAANRGRLDGVIDAFMRGASDSFDRVFERDDVADVLAGFLNGEIVFVLSRDELQVLRAPAAEPDPPTGQYL